MGNRPWNREHEGRRVMNLQLAGGAAGASGTARVRMPKPGRILSCYVIPDGAAVAASGTDYFTFQLEVTAGVVGTLSHDADPIDPLAPPAMTITDDTFSAGDYLQVSSVVGAGAPDLTGKTINFSVEYELDP